MSKSSTWTALKRLSAKKLDLATYRESMEVIEGTSDHRVIVIVYASIVETVIRDEIIRRMPHLNTTDISAMFEGHGPLATFSAKILVGYGIKAFGKEIRAELERIKDIRNAFAHGLGEITFHTKAVADACNLLQSPRFYSLLGPSFFGTPQAKHDFMTACFFLISRFENVSNATLPLEEWPRELRQP